MNGAVLLSGGESRRNIPMPEVGAVDVRSGVDEVRGAARVQTQYGGAKLRVHADHITPSQPRSMFQQHRLPNCPFMCTLLQTAGSNCVYEMVGMRSSPSLSRALSQVSSFRMQAVSATLGGFPGSISLV